MLTEYRKISRWLYESDQHRLFKAPNAGRWSVARLPSGLVFGHAVDLEAAAEVAQRDRRSNQYLTTGHEDDKIVSSSTGDHERDETMATDNKHRTCGCLPDYRNSTDDDGTETRVWLPCDSQIPAKRRFRSGHDAKLKSALIWAYRNGGTIHYSTEEGETLQRDAMEWAKELGWGHFMTLPKASKPKADKDDEVPEATTVEGFRPVRVRNRGRWYDGNLVSLTDTEATVSYEVKGETQQATLPLDSDRLELAGSVVDPDH